MFNHSIKAVLLDYGGVIADEGFQNGLRKIAHEQGLNGDATLKVAKYAIYDSGFVRGRGTEDEFWTLMRERSGLKDIDGESTNRILRGFVLRPWMIETVQSLRAQGYITGILSDQTHWLDWLNERDHFFQYFDYVFNSYHMGKGKRDFGIFQDIGEQLKLSAGEILFVDDMKSNVERATAAGWATIRYVGKAEFLAAIDGLLHPDHGQ